MKKFTVIAVVLFLFIGTGTYVFANPSENNGINGTGTTDTNSTTQKKNTTTDKNTTNKNTNTNTETKVEEDNNTILENEQNVTPNITNPFAPIFGTPTVPRTPNQNQGTNNQNNNVKTEEEIIKEVEKELTNTNITQENIDKIKEEIKNIQDVNKKSELEAKINEIQKTLNDNKIQEIKNAINTATNNLTQSNIDEARRLTNELKDEEKKQEYLNKINELQKTLNDNKVQEIRNAINVATNNLTQGNIEEAKKLANELKDETKKTELLNEIDKLQNKLNQINEIIRELADLNTNLNQSKINEIQKLINDLPSSEQQNYQNQLNTYINRLNQINEITKELEKLNTELNQPNINKIQKLINDLQSNEKQNFQNQLNTYINKLNQINEIIRELEKLNTELNQPNINKVQKLIDDLQSNEKQNLQTQLDVYKNKLTEDIKIQSAQNAIDNLKNKINLTQSDINNAQELITSLKDSNIKTNLQNELNKLQEQLNTTNLVIDLKNLVDSATNKEGINTAKNYKTNNSIVNKVNNLSNNAIKTNLLNILTNIDKILNDITVPVISGINNNDYLKNITNLTITDTNNYKIYLNDNYKQNIEDVKNSINADGVYKLTVIDAAFNQKEITFTIDKTKPNIVGVNNQTYANQVTINVDNETSDVTVNLTKNGQKINYTLGSVLKDNGIYTIYITDKAGNKSDEVTFTIDKTKPNIVGVNNQTYTGQVQIYVDNETSDVIVNLTKNGQKIDYTLGNVLKDNGTYTIYVTDKAGNKSEEITFTIDNTKPIISGVTNNQTYTGQVQIYVDNETSDVTVNLTKNGQKIDYTLGNVLKDNGTYVIYVVDKAGNKSEEITFKINNIPTTPFEFKHGGFFNSPIMSVNGSKYAVFQVCNLDLSNCSGKVSSYDISDDKIHGLKLYENENQEKYDFIVMTYDSISPEIKATGILNGTTINNISQDTQYDSVTLNIYDRNINTIKQIKDGQESVLSVTEQNTTKTFDIAGIYQITAIDRAGNETSIIFNIKSKLLPSVKSLAKAFSME